MQLLTPSLVLAFAGLPSCFASPGGRVLNEAVLEALAVLGKTAADYRLPGSLPFPNEKPGTNMLPGIEHIVMIMWENHSFDNIYGSLNRDDINGLLFNQTGQAISDVVQRYPNGSIQHLYEMPNNCAVTGHGPTQNWQSHHQQMNNDSMDGWVTAGGDDKPCAMGYWNESQLPTFHSLGKAFSVCDSWFASCPGQTWPNRMYQIAATSLGLVDTSQIIPGRDPAPAGNPDRGTIFNVLEEYNISWTNYVDHFGT
jgi:phospholipase C